MSDEITYNAASDEAMNQASVEARKTFRFLWRELSWERRRIVPALGISCVKIGFPTDGAAGAPQREYLWCGDIRFDGRTVTGTVLNSPQWVSRPHQGDSVAVALDKIDDWMYSIGSKVFGAFTVQVIRSRMGDDERDHHDKAWGLSFGSPDAVYVAQARRGDQTIHCLHSFSGLERLEHPMSHNMEEKFAAFLDANRDEIQHQDESGWTLLHHEATAGNAAMVRILLEKGADRDLPNRNGDRALDLASAVGWPEVVQLLS